MATLTAGNSGIWTMRGATFALWALAAASAVYWGMKFSATPAPVTSAAVPARSAPPVDPQAVARLLGANPTAAGAASPTAAPVATLASRFTLVGVAAQGRNGAALIAVDGKPPRPYRVGATLDEGIVLQSVRGRSAVLAANGEPVLTLEVPLPAQAINAPRAAPGGPVPGFPIPGGGAMVPGPSAGMAPATAPGMSPAMPGVTPGSMTGNVPAVMPGSGVPLPGTTAAPFPGPAQRPPMATPAPR